MDNRKFFKDKVIVITGASSGIGRASSLKLASYGAIIVLVSRNDQKLKLVKDEIESAGGRAELIHCDVSRPEEASRMTEEVIRTFGRTDILISCAGKYVLDTSATIDLKAFHESMDINFFGTLNIISNILPVMKNQKAGHIVIINSLDSAKGIVGDAPYVAAKSALDGFGDVLRQEMRPFNIKVTSVYPGRVDTPMIEQIRVPAISARINPSEVARALIKGIKRNRAIVTVPKSLCLIPLINKIAPVLTDRLYRFFKLEGEKIDK
jgi:short-subunit dehydrogenase